MIVLWRRCVILKSVWYTRHFEYSCKRCSRTYTRPGWVDTWARDTARWYWSADTFFWQLSIDQNIDVQSVFPWAPKVARKCESKHWYACGADGRSVYGHVITKFSRMGSLLHFLTHGAPLRAPLINVENHRRVSVMMWSAENTNLNEDMIVAVVIAL